MSTSCRVLKQDVGSKLWHMAAPWMFCCKTQDSAKLQDKKINSALKREQRKEEQTIKLLLLGNGEAGKSTITKQMKIIHINGYQEHERKETADNIRQNLKDSILCILGAMPHLGLKLHDPNNEEAADYVLQEASKDDFSFPQVFYDHVERLWLDEGVQESYSRSSEYQLIDCAKYFLDRVHVIRRDDYLPSDQDILRCRVMTNTIQQIKFSMKDRGHSVDFCVYDVGGQRGERRKWIQVFDRAVAILFVLDASSFDLMLREQPDKNRLLEAMDLFEQVWDNRFLRYVSIILFINKIDLLDGKIESGKYLSTLADSVRPGHRYHEQFRAFRDFHHPDECERKEFVRALPKPPGEKRGSSDYPVNNEVVRTAVFIKRMFMNLIESSKQSKEGRAKHDSHTCEYYYTCAVDTNNIKKVMEGCKSIIIKKHLEKIGVNMF